jgi:hypothetical protein
LPKLSQLMVDRARPIPEWGLSPTIIAPATGWWWVGVGAQLSAGTHSAVSAGHAGGVGAIAALSAGSASVFDQDAMSLTRGDAVHMWALRVGAARFTLSHRWCSLIPLQIPN